MLPGLSGRRPSLTGPTGVTIRAFPARSPADRIQVHVPSHGGPDRHAKAERTAVMEPWCWR